MSNKFDDWSVEKDTLYSDIEKMKEQIGAIPGELIDLWRENQRVCDRPKM